MRKTLIALVIAFAALPAVAKPVSTRPAIPDEARRSLFRASGLGICLSTPSDPSGNQLAARGTICTCALDRYTATHDVNALPRLTRDNFRSQLAAELTACGATAANGMAPATTPDGGDKPTEVQPPEVAPPPGATSVPDVLPAQDAVENAERAKRDSSNGSWFDGFGDWSLPSFSSLGIWGWAGIGLLVFLFFARRILRGGGGGRDLSGPPSSMRPGGASRPRPPNLPRN